MIRINLLAAHEFRKEKDRYRLFNKIFWGYGVLIAAFLIAYWNLGTHMQTLKEEKMALVRQTQAAAPLQKEIKGLKEKKEMAQTRLTLLQNLENDRHGPVRLMEILSSLLPVDQLWLISLKENGPEIRLEGISFSNETLSEFMKRLESSSLIKQVDLIQSTQSLYKDLKVKQFTLTAWTEPPPPPLEKK
ncbi:MAG: PilN domain-containing protein [Thermodesulfobacteriota bacterium]